jgi:hypothetical protein
VAALLLTFKQGWARPAGWTAAAAALLIVGTRAARRGWKASRDDRSAARALGRSAPDDASDLLSAVELAPQLEADSSASRAMIRAHILRMSARAARLDPRPAQDPRPLRLALAAAVTALVAHAALFEFGGPKVRDAYAFLTGTLASASAPLFAPEPIAGDVTLTYRYPAHMNRAARTVAGTDGDISAPKGTVVDVTARADRDVVRAAVVVTEPGQAPKVVPLEVQGRMLSGRLLIDQPGQWRFRYTRESGRIVAEGPDRPIAIEPDLAPEVRLLKPAAEVEISGQEVLTLSYSANDDYGLRGLDLVWNTGKGVPEQHKRLFKFKDGSRRESGDVNWDIGQLGVKPGDRITYRLEAWDNDSVSGGETGKKGVSNTQVLKVFSETEHHEELLREAREHWEKLVGAMGDRLEEPPAGREGEKATEQWQATTGAKDTLVNTIATDMRAFARKVKDDAHAPPEIGRAMAHVASRLMGCVEETVDARTTVARFPNGSTAGSFTSTLGKEIREEEKDVLYLEDLMDRRRLSDLAELTRQLEEGRKELADLVKQYKAAPTEENKQRILAQVARLKERLNDLYRRMRELAREIQDEHLNTEAREMMDKGEDLMSKLDQVQRDLSKGGGDDALKAVEDLEKQIKNMEQEFSERAGDTDEEQKKMNGELQRLASDLIDLQGDETQLKKDTDDLRSKEREAVKEKAQKLGGEFVEKQRERIRRARSGLSAVSPELARRYGEEEQLQAALDRLNQLDRAIQSGDFEEALGQAQQAGIDGEGVRMRLTEERDMQERYGGMGAEMQDLGKSAWSAEQAQTPLRQVTEDLEKLLKTSKPSVSEGERRQMREMGQRQAGVQQRAEHLGQRLDQLSQEMPIAGPEQSKLLQEAAGSMGKAKDALGEANARGASAREADALSKLNKFADSMKQRASSGGGGAGGMPMPFGSDGDEEAPGDMEGNGSGAGSQKVELPSADQSHAPAEFRRDILDAMKDKAPDKYRERVRNYYEELVK